MHSHLAIIGKNGELTLKPDQSIKITEKNPMFNDVEMFSQTFQLPFEKNRHLLKNMEARDSSMRATDVENERFRIVMDGIPARTATLKVQDDVVLNDSIDVNLDATNRTFKDMIADMRCRDVTVDDDILIGEKIGDVNFHIEYQQQWRIGLSVYNEHFNQFTGESEGWFYDSGYIRVNEVSKTTEGTFQPPVLGFSYPAKCLTESDGITAVKSNGTITIDGKSVITPVAEELYINTKMPYGSADENGKHWPFCNSRICYSHHDRENDGHGNWQTADALVSKGAATPDDKHNFGPYWVLDADRPASGICFYVGYFLEKLFNQLGMDYDMTALTNIVDFNYLCFFTTSCKYRTENTDLVLNNVEDINKWLSSRGCGGKLSIDISEAEREKKYTVLDMRLDSYHQYLHFEQNEYDSYDDYVTLYYNNEQVCRVKLVNNDGSIDPMIPGESMEKNPMDGYQWVRSVQIEDSFYYHSEISNKVVMAYVQKMYATSDNFPDVNVSEVIESLENSFGVRFCYDVERNKITVRLLRDMFRNQQPPIPFKGKVLSMCKVSEKITGIKMGYSAESDAQEQRDNIRYQKRDYDTTYDYMEYPQGRTLLASYANVTKLVDIGNMNCYVDLATGDAFRIKIDSDAKTVAEMKPSLFEVGGLKGAEMGDCSKENEDYVREFRSSFEPVICNILKRNQDGSILLVPFIDEDMEHELIPIKVQNVMAVGKGEVYFNYDLTLLENYDPTSTDDGQSPLMSHDWGLTVGILRPGAGTAAPYEYDEGYDGFGNSRWGISSEDYAVTADSYDVKGHFLGISPAGSFSLKPCAYKPFRYYYDTIGSIHISTNPKEWDDPIWLIPCNDDVRNGDGTIASRICSRGMRETFMIEFFRFLLYRQRYEVKALCTAAELIDIPNQWLRRWNIDGKVGFMNIIEYSANTETGLGEVTIDFYSM